MFDRIVSDPEILGGKPIIKGTRISVEMILEWIASGGGRDDILKAHPHLSAEDIEQARKYANMKPLQTAPGPNATCNSQ